MLFELPIIVLDIGSTKIRFIELKRRRGGRIKRFYERLPRNIVHNNAIIELDLLAKQVKALQRTWSVYLEAKTLLIARRQCCYD